MRIGIIGAGMIGGTAARLFTQAGHEVGVSNSRVARLIEEIGFAPVDTGSLRDGRRQQPDSPIYNQSMTGREAREARETLARLA